MDSSRCLAAGRVPDALGCQMHFLKKSCSAIANLSLHRAGLALRRDTQPSVSTLD